MFSSSSVVGVDARYDVRLSKLEAGKVFSCLRMQASPKAEQVKDTANAEIPAPRSPLSRGQASRGQTSPE